MSIEPFYIDESSQILAFDQQLGDLPRHAIIKNYTKRYAYGTDASFYRLVPQRVVVVDTVAQLQKVLSAASSQGLSVTFRAAGTSLSGQAITDSILVVLSDAWRDIEVLESGEKIRLQPKVTGAQANAALADFAKKIGPDPASINSAQIGGIVANNASGMCCGVEHNSYHTIEDLVLVFADGTVLDTADRKSVAEFRERRASLVSAIRACMDKVRADEALRSTIAHKYRIKNTTGYGINALIDFDDEIEVIKRLVVGSEGTLAFMAEATYKTVCEYQNKATGMVVFRESRAAVEFIQSLDRSRVDAVELLDKRSLEAVVKHDALPFSIDGFPDTVIALLIESSTSDADQLREHIQTLDGLVAAFGEHIIERIELSRDKATRDSLWRIRKGTFPAVGANREIGTTVIIEDVAFELGVLATGITRLQKLLEQHGYHDGLIFGHALAGNLHFVFSQRFDSPEERERYRRFMAAVAEVVVKELGGSLKAEHGTGRNMAPFVELEWGGAAYELMREIKSIFDPDGLLNPGVIINDDQHIHLKNTKTMPELKQVIDTCIECGFCERVCPSKNLTLTPRQRITVWRRMIELEESIAQTPNQALQRELKQLKEDFQELGIESCAATGLCGLECPVGINTGEFVKALRSQRSQGVSPLKWVTPIDTASYGMKIKTTRLGLRAMRAAQDLLGRRIFDGLYRVARALSFGALPANISGLPQAAETGVNLTSGPPANPTVVYLPSCGAKTFGPPDGATDTRSLTQAVISVLEKAGYRVVLPPNVDALCCGLPWASRGDERSALLKQAELAGELRKLSCDGEYPIVTDASSCALRLEGQEVFELADFFEHHVIDRLSIKPVEEPIMLHVTCSTKRSGVESSLVSLAKRCAVQVVIPSDIHCCGFAGDKGLFYPALNASSLASLREEVPQGCTQGVSNNRTCEIGLSQHSGINYQSIAYLLDNQSTPKS